MIFLVRFLVLGLTLAQSAVAQSASTATEVDAARSSALDSLLAHLETAEERGVVYVNDTLTKNSRQIAPLMIHTQLADPSRCGRREHGWSVDAGVADAYTYVVVRDLPILGNRSQLSQFSFRSTQKGVRRGEHGLVEMRLCRGTNSDNVPVRVRIEDGRFYILGLNQDALLAGDRDKPVFAMSAETTYTLKVLLFEKAVYATVSGADISGGRLDLVIPDRYRFVPGRPGFGLRPNPQATGGDLAVFNWQVTPAAPRSSRLAVIGDSITAGSDREPEAESYVYQATRLLGQPRVLNTGSGGSTTTLDLARFPYEIAPFKPDIVWIEGGTNDIGTGVLAETVFQNLQRQVALVNWGGRAVLSTVPPRTLAAENQHVELERLNRMIRESGIPYVDRNAIVADSAEPRQIKAEYRHADGIHILKDGHARIAAEAVRLFRELPGPSPRNPLPSSETKTQNRSGDR